MTAKEFFKKSLNWTKSFLVKTIKNYWFEILLFLLVIFLYFFETQKLIIGGISFILIGIKQYFIKGFKTQNPSMLLLGMSIIYIGIISIFTKALLIIDINAWIFIILLMALVILLFYFKSERHFVFGKLIVIPLILLMVIVLSFTIPSLIKSIYEQGISTIYFYFALIIFIILINFSYFILINNLFLLIKMKNSKYFALGIAISLFIFISGYFYLKYVSDNQIKDFILIISSAFIVVWGAISSFKTLR